MDKWISMTFVIEMVFFKTKSYYSALVMSKAEKLYTIVSYPSANWWNLLLLDSMEGICTPVHRGERMIICKGFE